MRIKIAFILFYTFLSAVSSAQQYPFVHYTPKDGLVNSRVRKAYQDSKGRMYFSTYGGLSVYDGARFKNYTTQNGLLSDLVNDVLEVGEDSLLVATNTCGLNVLVKGQMKVLKTDPGACPIFNQFIKSNDGEIYASTDSGLYKITRTGFINLLKQSQETRLPVEYLGSITEYKDYLIFGRNDLRYNTGLFLYNKKTNRVSDVLPDDYICSIEKGPSGTLWLSTDKKIYQIDTVSLSRGKLVILPAEYHGDHSMTGFINFTKDNELAISAGSKLRIIRKSGIVEEITLPDFSETSAQDFFIDRENIVWICHDGKGLYKLPPVRLQSILPATIKNKSSLRTISASAISGKWMATNDKRLVLFNRTGSQEFSTSPELLVNVLLEGKNNIYIGNRSALYKVPLPSKGQTHLSLQKVLDLDTSGLGGRAVMDLQGHLIFFTNYEIIVMADDNIIFRYPVSPYDLVEEMIIKEQRLWIVTRSKGLLIFSIHPEDPVHYLHLENHFEKELAGASARAIVLDNEENIWIGTRYEGLLCFRMENAQLKKIYHFHTQNGLTDNYVTSLATNKNDDIIAGTQTGLDRLTKNGAEYRLENISKHNNAFSFINMVWTDTSDNIYAWTKEGDIFTIVSSAITKKDFVPSLLIEEIKINGKYISIPEKGLRLRHEQRNITFSVAAPSFVDEKLIKFSYLLSGAGQKEWSDTSTSADINLLNLTPGNYTLHIKAFFPSVNYPVKETEYSFSILPPWWQTTWFRIIAALLIVTLLVAGIRFYYRRKLEKQRVVLERQQAIEKERTRIATDMHDDLGAGLSTIRFLSEKVKRNSFSEVTKDDSEKIVVSSNDLMQKMNEIIWAMNEKNDSLEDLIFYTRSYAVEYCNENGLTCETNLPASIPPLFVSGEIRRNVFLTVKESLHNIVKHARAQKVIIDFSINQSLMITVKDDGQGIKEKNNSQGNGLRNMKKRVESIDGAFEVIDRDGVEVKLSVPLS